MSLLDAIRVLVVDDERAMLDALTDLLSSEGADARGVLTSAEALIALASREPHVMVVDIELPDEDGFALLARARAQGTKIPAIAITAH